jgi:hypothetical protein
MNSVYISGQEFYDLANDETIESDIPEDFIDYVLFEQMQLDNLPLHGIEIAKTALLRSDEFVDYLRTEYVKSIEPDY